MPKNHEGRELCHFTYADGRRCTLPQFPDDYGLCYHHANQHHARLASNKAGREISRFLNTDVLTASDLSASLMTAFASTAQGYTKPKTAMALVYLARLLFQVQQVAKQEFLEAFDEKWSKVVEEAPAFNPTELAPGLQPKEPSQTPSSVSQTAPDSILVPEPPPADTVPANNDEPAHSGPLADEVDEEDDTEENVIALSPSKKRA